MKKKILAFGLAMVTVLSFVACGDENVSNENVSNENIGNDHLHIDTETVSEETPETEKSQSTWETMTVRIDGMDITFPCTRRDTTIDKTAEAQGPCKIHIMNDITPNENGIGTTSNVFLVQADNSAVYNKSYFTQRYAKLYFPTSDLHQIDSQIFLIDIAFSLSAIYSADGGEIVLPEIELPNGLKIGDLIHDDAAEIIAAYGEPLEVKTTGQKYGYGDEYVYKSADGTKSFSLYTASNKLIGFKMWVDIKAYDFYNH